MEHFNNLAHLMSEEPHELSNRNRTLRTATCSVCGPDIELITPRRTRLGMPYTIDDMRCMNDRDDMGAANA